MNFHTRLMFIQRNSFCQCGVCQSATDLSLKFIAHRLLKNSIDSDEYILISKQFIDCSQYTLPSNIVKWTAAKQEYNGIGEVEFEYTLLSYIKKEMRTIIHFAERHSG